MRNRTSVIAVVLAVLALGAAGWAIYAPYVVRQDAAAMQSQAKTLADQVAEACAKGGQAAAELGPACAKAAEVKDQPAVAQPATVDPAQLREAARTAVSEYCATRDGCRGTDGSTPNFDAIVDVVLARMPVPRDGRDGQDGDAASAVAEYCGLATEPCRGPAGTNGVNGTNGADGKDGKDGQPGPTCPTGYEVRDAVITAPDGGTYQGKACVDPASSKPPNPLPIK